MKKTLSHLLVIASLLLASCGYVSDKPVANTDVYKTDELQTCKIDITKLSEIFKADQKQQIKCLQDNFIQFTKYVRSKNPGSVNEVELKAFIKKFFEGQSESIVKGLSIIFQLNMILLKDEADRISHGNITPLFELLIQINQEAVIITDILKQMDDEKNQGRFWELREKFNESIKRFSTTAISIIDKSPGLSKKLNIREFVLEASKKIGDKPIDKDTVDCFIFLKRLLLAGDHEVITTDELKTLIDRLPNLLSMVFDLFYATNKNFNNDADQIKFYLDQVTELYSIIQFNQNDFTLITSEQLTVIMEKFFKETEENKKDKIDVRKFKKTLEIYKQKFIGGKPEEISLKDLRIALDIANDLMERIYFNDVTYENSKGQLEKKTPEAIKVFEKDDLKEYEIFSDRRVNELHKSFADVVTNFRYFRNRESGANYYGIDFLRNKYGFQEVAIAKWVAIKLIKAYGHKDSNGINQVSIKEFNQFLLDSQPLLEEFKMWSNHMDTFAENSLLLADLFQHQSNGDSQIGINEATEYISMILSATKISGKVNTETIKVCKFGDKKDDPKFDKECFNEHFFDVLLEKLNYKAYMPNLNRYVEEKKDTANDELLAYLKGVEGFARDEDKEGVPVNGRDSTLILGAMLNIESTFIRFDLNNDNIIDYNELVKSFDVYKKSIIEIAELKAGQEKYALPAFLYMVSKMKTPPRGRLIDDAAFMFWAGCATNDICRKTIMDEINAKRLNIGKLLHNLILMREKKNEERPTKDETSKGKKLLRLWNE